MLWGETTVSLHVIFTIVYSFFYLYNYVVHSSLQVQSGNFLIPLRTVFLLSFIYGKFFFLNTPFVEPVHWSCHFVNNISFSSVVIVSLGFLSYTISPVPSVAASFARRSAVSFPWIPVWAFTHLKNTVHSNSSSLFISFVCSILSWSVCFYSSVCPVSSYCLC